MWNSLVLISQENKVLVKRKLVQNKIVNFCTFYFEKMIVKTKGPDSVSKILETPDLEMIV
jgi:hypothetical protein